MPQWFSENKSCVRKLLTFLAAATAMPGVCVTRYPSFSLAKIRVNISPLSQSLKITQNVSFWFSQFWFLFIAPDSNGQICTVLCNVVKCHFLCDFQIQWVLLLLPFQQKIWKCNRAAPIFSQYIPKPRFHTKSSKGWGHTAEASLTRCFKIPTSFHFEISFYNILGAKIQVAEKILVYLLALLDDFFPSVVKVFVVKILNFRSFKQLLFALLLLWL